MATTIICQATDCRWNKEGMCRADQIMVGPGPAVDCKIYEPTQAGGAPDLRQQLMSGMAAGGAPGGMPMPPMGPSGPPRIPEGIY